MILMEDTRNPVSKHQNIHSYCKEHGIVIERTKLYVGDYTLPTDQSICVDTKADMQEVYGNVIQSHKRFREEVIRARAAGIRLIILVEQSGIKDLEDAANWKNPRIAKWYKVTNAHKNGKMISVKVSKTPPVSSPKLAAKMQELARRYGVEWQFCDKSETGQRIIEILSNGN